ncbi:DegV family protein [Vagococcus elongatus]|uniref:EDD domain protein n=1 Tax=Vagococcus elongatus TaxID=180344 RepID=A0A430B5M5_9ENTE|nr:DegV family protein [Vagococcus elongatus]RSU15612.1 EDD domain protein [Vagococcus elongatus]
MSKVKIVTDSSAKFEPGVAEALGVEIISLSIMVDDVIYKDSAIDGAEYMKMMAAASALPKTSQPPIGEFVEVYDRLGADGSEIISLHLTGLLSGTVEAARQASQISKSKVTVIDSHFTDQSLAFLVEDAAQLANDGADAETILAAIEKGQKNSLLYIGVANLNNLVKGGRISRATGVLSNVFNIRVVMQLLDTGLETMSKGRGNKAFNRWFDDLKKEKLNKLSSVKKIGISHAAGLETALKFKEELQEMFPNVHIPVLDTSPIVATHTGEGAFAIMLYLE